jgi:hypothetical protein
MWHHVDINWEELQNPEPTALSTRIYQRSIAYTRFRKHGHRVRFARYSLQNLDSSIEELSTAAQTMERIRRLQELCPNIGSAWLYFVDFPARRFHELDLRSFSFITSVFIDQQHSCITSGTQSDDGERMVDAVSLARHIPTMQAMDVTGRGVKTAAGSFDNQFVDWTHLERGEDHLEVVGFGAKIPNAAAPTTAANLENVLCMVATTTKLRVVDLAADFVPQHNGLARANMPSSTALLRIIASLPSKLPFLQLASKWPVPLRHLTGLQVLCLHGQTFDGLRDKSDAVHFLYTLPQTIRVLYLDFQGSTRSMGDGPSTARTVIAALRSALARTDELLFPSLRWLFLESSAKVELTAAELMLGALCGSRGISLRMGSPGTWQQTLELATR